MGHKIKYMIHLQQLLLLNYIRKQNKAISLCVFLFINLLDLYFFKGKNMFFSLLLLLLFRWFSRPSAECRECADAVVASPSHFVAHEEETIGRLGSPASIALRVSGGGAKRGLRVKAQNRRSESADRSVEDPLDSGTVAQ